MKAETLTIINLIFLFFIAKYMFVYERYKISIKLFKWGITIWLLKFDYKDCQYYRHKIILNWRIKNSF